MKGTVKFFNPTKGFGFVIGDDGVEYFLHQSQILNKENLDKDDIVKFEGVESPKGPQANQVCKSED